MLYYYNNVGESVVRLPDENRMHSEDRLSGLFQRRRKDMIDAKKVRKMTWLSVYENGIGAKDLKMNLQTQSTYTALRLIESVIIVTFIFLVCTALYGFRFYMKLMSASQDLSILRQFIPLGVVYLVILILTLIITKIWCGRKYRAMKKRVMEYDRNLYRLKKYLDEKDPD